jgi:hypothetical protein
MTKILSIILCFLSAQLLASEAVDKEWPKALQANNSENAEPQSSC